jgi:hypothetical protein
MTDPTNRPPLWQVMNDVRDEVCDNTKDSTDRQIWAAELRAIVEEAERRYEGNDPATSLIAWLELEADKAEAGDDTTNS